MKIQSTRAAALATLLLGAGVSFAAASGCVGYANYPAIGGDVAANDPNAPPMTDLILQSLDWIDRRYEPRDPYAVNLPEGMLRKRVFQILERHGNQLTRPLTPETDDLPIYHISRIWVRGNRAEVDIHRPIESLSDQGASAYQTITLTLRGGFRPWDVVSSRTHVIGAVPPPELHYIPEEDKPEPVEAPDE